jgi:hypothetical protein
MQKYNLQKKKKKNPSKRNQKLLPRYHNSIITNLNFQHKPKYHVSKNPHIKK